MIPCQPLTPTPLPIRRTFRTHTILSSVVATICTCVKMGHDPQVQLQIIRLNPFLYLGFDSLPHALPTCMPSATTLDYTTRTAYSRCALTAVTDCEAHDNALQSLVSSVFSVMIHSREASPQNLPYYLDEPPSPCYYQCHDHYDLQDL